MESEKLAKFLQNMAKVDTMLKQSQQRDKQPAAAAGFTLKSLLKIITVKGKPPLLYDARYYTVCHE